MVDGIPNAQCPYVQGPYVQQQKVKENKNSGGLTLLGTAASAVMGAATGYGLHWHEEKEFTAKHGKNEDEFIKKEKEKTLKNGGVFYEDEAMGKYKDTANALEKIKNAKLKYVAGGAAISVVAVLGLSVISSLFGKDK